MSDRIDRAEAFGNPLHELNNVGADRTRAYAKQMEEQALKEAAEKVEKKKERKRSMDETEKIIENIRLKFRKKVEKKKERKRSMDETEKIMENIRLKFRKKDEVIDNSNEPNCNCKIIRDEKGARIEYRKKDM